MFTQTWLTKKEREEETKKQSRRILSEGKREEFLAALRK